MTTNALYCAYQWYALPPIPGVQWEIGGELTCTNAIPEAQSRVLSPYTSLSNVSYLPGVHSV